MAFLDQPIHVTELPEDTGGSYEPLPAGDYDVTIKDASIKPTADGTGQYIKLRLDVDGPTHAGRVVFTNLNIRNKSQQAESIGRAQLGSVMKALGVDQLTDTDQLIGGRLNVKLSVREARTDEKTGKTYDPSNEVKAYRPVNGAASAARPSFGAPAAPAKVSAPATQPSASKPAAGGAVPPWMKGK